MFLHTWVRIPLFPILIIKKTFNILYFSFTKFFTASYNNIFSLRIYVSTYSRAWNPYFFRSILGSRIGFTILNPLSTYSQIKKMLMFIRNVFVKNGKLLILNECTILPIQQAYRYTLFKNWIPGILTNKAILKSKIKKTNFNFYVPSATILFKPRLGNVSFLRESRNILLPSISIMDTHFNHTLGDYVILSNFNEVISQYYMSILNSLDNDVLLNLSFKYLKFKTPTLASRNKILRIRNIKKLYTRLKNVNRKVSSGNIHRPHTNFFFKLMSYSLNLRKNISRFNIRFSPVSVYDNVYSIKHKERKSRVKFNNLRRIKPYLSFPIGRKYQPYKFNLNRVLVDKLRYRLSSYSLISYSKLKLSSSLIFNLLIKRLKKRKYRVRHTRRFKRTKRS
jgi:hypothetical protein